MKRSRMILLVACVWLTAFATIASADINKKKTIKKDRKLIQGEWQAVALEVNGNQSQEEDARKIRVINGDDGTWKLLVQDSEIASGTSTIDPTQDPKTIDLTVIEGDAKGKKYLGIYQLGKNKRRLCFAPEGKDRPSEFATAADNGHILVTFERVK